MLQHKIIFFIPSRIRFDVDEKKPGLRMRMSEIGMEIYVCSRKNQYRMKEKL